MHTSQLGIDAEPNSKEYELVRTLFAFFIAMSELFILVRMAARITPTIMVSVLLFASAVRSSCEVTSIVTSKVFALHFTIIASILHEYLGTF